MRFAHQKRWVIAAAVGAVAALLVMRQTWIAAPVVGVVVDAATRAPVGGAVVVAVWSLTGGLEAAPRGIVVVRETATDARGAFRVAGWGPKVFAPGRYVAAREPMLYVIQRGHAITARESTAPDAGPLDRAFLNVGSGNTRVELALDPAQSAADYRRTAEPFVNLLRANAAVDPDLCLGDAIPLAIAELEVIRASLGAEADLSGIPTRRGWGAESPCSR